MQTGQAAQLAKVQHGGFEAAVLGYVTGDYNVGLVYLRMIGPHDAVRAIWAKLSDAKTRRRGWSGVEVCRGDRTDGVHLERHTSYCTVSTRLPCGYVDLALLHPRATTAHSSDPFYVVVEKGEPPASFYPRFSRDLAIPVLPEWAGILWKMGIEGMAVQEKIRSWSGGEERVLTKTVCPIRSLGGVAGSVQGYEVRTNSEKAIWLAIILSLLGLEVPEGRS